MSNLDDFDQPPENFEPEHRAPERKSSVGTSIKNAWGASPVFKIFLLLVGGGAIASAALGVFNSDSHKDSKSVVQEGSSISATPGGEAPPAFQEAVNEASTQRAQQAARQGGSALPTPMGNTTQMTNLDPSGQNQNDPLAEFRAQQAAENPPAAAQQQQPQQARNNQARTQQQQQQQEALDQNLANAMQQQMQSIMQGWNPAAAKVIKVADTAAQNNGQGGAGGSSQQQAPQSFDYGKTLVQAGTINYGQMLLEANSDVPGPIMAQILSGPFAGARAVGQFQTTDNYLVIRFNLVNFKGKDYPVDILALDPDTTLGGLATETDQRYFSRIFLPAAAEFISGFAQGFTQADQNIYIADGVVVSKRASGSARQGFGQGAEEAGDRVAAIVNEQAQHIKPLVKVAAGTPVGLFFTKTVTENNPTPQQQQQMLGTYPQGSLYGPAGVNPYAVPGVGTAGTGYGMTGYGAGYSPYAAQNGAYAGGYAYPTAQQGTNNPYGPLNNGSSSTNYGSGVTVIPANGALYNAR